MIAIAQQASPSAGAPTAPPRGKKPRVSAAETWKMVDADADGSLTAQEFASLPRMQKLPEQKRGEIYQRLDKDSNGKLTQEELAKLGAGNRRGLAQQRFSELDTDRNQSVSFEEFQKGPLFVKLALEDQKEVFKKLDADGDGSITQKDHPDKPPQGGKPPGLPPGEVMKLDSNKDGSVSFDEFKTDAQVKDLTEDEQEDRFEALDKNHDQKLMPGDFPPPPPSKTE